MPERLNTETVDLRLAPLKIGNPVPLYHQLYSTLYDMIRNGDLPQGKVLPSESQLATQLNVSRITIKRAYNELAQSKLVSRRRGIGTIVIANTELNFTGGVNDYVANVAKLREMTEAEILGRETVPASEGIASNLNIPPNTLVEKITHCLVLRDEILSYNITYIPHGLSENFDTQDLLRESLLTLLINSGVRITRAEQKVSAVLADEDKSNLFKSEANGPLLKIHCVMIDNDDRPVEDIYAWYHPDRYQYQMSLTDLDQPT